MNLKINIPERFTKSKSIVIDFENPMQIGITIRSHSVSIISRDKSLKIDEVYQEFMKLNPHCYVQGFGAVHVYRYKLIIDKKKSKS